MIGEGGEAAYDQISCVLHTQTASQSLRMDGRPSEVELREIRDC